MKDYIQEEALIQMRRELHQFAELGMQLPKTCTYVYEKLKSFGYEPSYLGGGVVAQRKGNHSDTILLRADMDALPIVEASGLSFASEHDGIAHCCGHDLHTAMLLETARILANMELDYSVLFVFQPGEELGLGAKAMIDAGVLSLAEIKASFSIHVMALAPLGVVAGNFGTVMAASDSFDIDIHGKGCHGSTPYEGIDPIMVAAHMVLALQEITTREIKANDVIALTMGSIQGGNCHNAIPSDVKIQGTLRTFDESLRTFIKGRMKEIITTCASLYRAQATLSFPYEIPSFPSNQQLCEHLISSLQAKELPFNVFLQNEKSFGSEDYAHFANAVPSTMFILGAQVEGSTYGQHHPKVAFNEKCLIYGVQTFLEVVDCWHQDIKY